MLSHSSPKHRSASHNLKLSQLLLHSKSAPKSSTLKLEKQKITHIDILPQGISSQIEQLYLSQNMIKRLTNVSQFGSLRIIDLSYNQIEDCSQLLTLKNLQSLESVRIKGNPFLNLDINIQVLEFLNKKEIDIEFKEKEQEMIIQKSVLESYLELIFLQHALGLIEIHIELIKRFDTSGEGDINVNYILSEHSKFKQYDKVLLSKYLQSIKIQAYRIKEQNQSSLLNAYKQIQQYQYNKKQQLTKSIIVKFTQYNRQRKKKYNKNMTPTKTTTKYRNRNQSRDRSSLSPLYNMQLGQQTIKLKITPSFNKLPLLQTQKKLYKLFQNQNKYDQRYHKNLPKLNPVYNLLYSPVNSLKPTEKNLLINNLSDDLKKMAISLYLKEEEGINREQELSDEIEQMKDQLNNVKKQNDQLNEIIEQRQKQLKKCKIDKQTISKLEMMLKNKDKQIAQLKRQTEQYKSQIFQLEDQINRNQQYDEIEEIIRQRKEKNRVKQVWGCVLEKYRKMQRFKNSQQKRMSIQNKNLYTTIFSEWRQVTEKHLALKSIASKINSKQLYLFFLQFKQSKSISKISHFFNSKLKQQRTKNYSKILLKHLSQDLLNKKLNQRSEFHYKKQLLQRSFRSIKIQWIRYNSPAFKDASNQIIKHYQMKLKVKTLQGFIINKRLQIQSRNQEISQLNKAYEREEMERKQLSQQMRILKKSQIRRKLMVCFELRWKDSIRNICNQKIKQFYLSDVIKIRKIKNVMVNLRQNSRRFLGYKQDKLTSTIKEMRLKTRTSDFKTILKISMKHKKLVHQNIIRSLVKKQYDAFHYLKMLPVHRKIDNAPRIDVSQIQYRESHLIKITELLKLEIQTKDQQTSLCHQKISQLEFAITSQDLKYQQLKAIHEGSILEMRRREAELLETIMRMEGRKQYVPVRDIMRDDLKKARIFNEGEKNSVYKRSF